MPITRLLGWPCYRPISVGPPFPFRTVLVNGFLGTALAKHGYCFDGRPIYVVIVAVP